MQLPVGKRLQAIRKQKRITAAQIAEKIGISRPYVTQLEGGKRRLSVENLLKIAEMLGVSVPEIFGERGDASAGVESSASIWVKNTVALRRELKPLVGKPADDLVECFRLWMRMSEGSRRALQRFAEVLEEEKRT